MKCVICPNECAPPERYCDDCRMRFIANMIEHQRRAKARQIRRHYYKIGRRRKP